MSATPITDAIRKAICAEPPTVPFVDIAQRYGVSWYVVKNIRVVAGLNTITGKPIKQKTVAPVKVRKHGGGLPPKPFPKPKVTLALSATWGSQVMARWFHDGRHHETTIGVTRNA